jgi:putative endonuclease
MFYVSVLESEKKGELYVGQTKDLRNGLEEHSRGLTSSTKRYLPWKLVFYEACLNEFDVKKTASAAIKRVFLL